MTQAVPQASWGSRLVSQDQLKQIITSETTESLQLLNELAEKIGRDLADNVSTSQIRSIFGEVRTIEQDTRLEPSEKLSPGVQRSLIMLRPKLAYQYGRVPERERDKKRAMLELTTILSYAISLIGDQPLRFRNFVDFFEAILAYHRRYGGRTN